jgi:uncharacterized membrane protein YhaH (DUF805 family)
MGFWEAVRSVFNQYATFSGRARRAEFWWFVLFNFLGQMVAGIADLALFGEGTLTMGMGRGEGMAQAPSVIGGIFSLVVLIPGLAVGARRLHDIGRSGWWQLLWIIPIIGFIVLLWWMTTRGYEGPNDYGPDPIREGGGDSYAPSSVPKVPREP